SHRHLARTIRVSPKWGKKNPETAAREGSHEPNVRCCRILLQKYFHSRARDYRPQSHRRRLRAMLPADTIAEIITNLAAPSSSSPWCRCLAGGVSWFDPPNLARGGDLGGVLAVPLLDLVIESAIGGLAVETCIASGTGTDDDARRVAKLVGGAF